LNALGAVLAILNILTILGPIAGVAIVYQSNLKETIIPPQLQEIMNGGNGGGGGIDSLGGISFDQPQFVSAVANGAARSVTIILNFTNPFNYDLDLNSVSADIVCQEHNFVLGHANLIQSTTLKANQTSDLAIVCQWSIDAENHFLNGHTAEPSIDVNIVGLTIGVNDITIQLKEPYAIPDLPISANIPPPKYVSSITDLAGRSVTLTFSFANPFPYDLNIDAVSANAECLTHGYPLGQASLVSEVTIPALGSSNFQILFSWSQSAEDHMSIEHPGATSLDVNLDGLTVNVNGMQIHVPGSYQIPSVPLG
jgi:hypothetical protein